MYRNLWDCVNDDNLVFIFIYENNINDNIFWTLYTILTIMKTWHTYMII